VFAPNSTDTACYTMLQREMAAILSQVFRTVCAATRLNIRRLINVV